MFIKYIRAVSWWFQLPPKFLSDKEIEESRKRNVRHIVMRLCRGGPYSTTEDIEKYRAELCKERKKRESMLWRLVERVLHLRLHKITD